MRAQESKKGEVTAFLALTFILLVSFAGSLMESASIQTAKSYRRADMNRAMESIFAEYQRELLEEFDLFALDGSYESGTYQEEKLISRLSYYGASGMAQKIERIELLTDHNGRPLLEQIYHYMKEKYKIASLGDLLGDMDSLDGKEEQGEDYRHQEAALQNQLGELLEENELELPAEKNPLPNMQRILALPLTELVLPSEKAVSEKSIESENLASGRELDCGYGDFSDVSESPELAALAFGEYVLTHFDTAVEEEARGGALDYEVEYLIGGKSVDKENLEHVLRRLLLLRYVPNYLFLQGSAAKRAEAEALAITLCAVAAVPAVTEVLTQVLLLGWAFGESILDLRSLMKGNGIPMIKSEDTWQLSLSGLMTLGNGEELQDGADTDGGMKYRDYLRALLFLKYRDGMALRTLDLIELRLRTEKGLAWFRADACISKLGIESTVKLRRGITYRFRTYYGYQ